MKDHGMSQGLFNPFFQNGDQWFASGGEAPENSVLPAITGTPNIGETLTASTGTWLNGTDSFTYQWKNNGVNIASATNNTYVLTADDAEDDITVSVTATNDFGSTPAESAATVCVTKISLTGRTSAHCSGDSMTVGQNASVAGERYVNQWTTGKSLALTNAGVSGKGMWNVIDVLRGTTVTRASVVMTVMGILNDIRRGGSAAKTLKKVESAARSVILYGILNARTAAGAAAVTRTGSHTGFAANQVGGFFPTGTPNANCATFVNGTGSWSWGFTGTAFGVQFIANSGDVQTFGTVTIKIDGVLVKTVNLNDGWYDNVSDGAYDNRRGPLAYSFHGLTKAI